MAPGTEAAADDVDIPATGLDERARAGMERGRMVSRALGWDGSLRCVAAYLPRGRGSMAMGLGRIRIIRWRGGAVRFAREFF